MSSAESLFDIFLVYNKLDYDLVHNVIAPLLRSNRHTRLAFEHFDRDNKDPTDFERLLRISGQSEGVMFVFSRNSLTKLEYELIARTPHIKRMAMLVDGYMFGTIKEGVIDPNKVFVLNGVRHQKSSSSCSASSVITMSTGEDTKSNEGSSFDDGQFESSTLSDSSYPISRVFRKTTYVSKQFEI